MFGWQQWRGPFQGNGSGMPQNAGSGYGNGPNNGMGFQGGWVQGANMPPPHHMGPPPSNLAPGMMPPMGAMHGGWQQQQMGPQNTGFGMGQSYGPSPGGGMMMNNPNYGGGSGDGVMPEMVKPPFPPQPQSVSATAEKATTSVVTLKPPPPPPEEKSKTKDGVLVLKKKGSLDKPQKLQELTEKEAEENRRLEQLKQQAQQWQKQMATIQQQTTSAMAFTATPLQQQQLPQFMGGDTRFTASVTQQPLQPPPPPLPIPHFTAPVQLPPLPQEDTTINKPQMNITSSLQSQYNTVMQSMDAPRQPAELPRPPTEAPRQPMETTRTLETPKQSTQRNNASSQPNEAPIAQKKQQVDSFQSGNDRTTTKNNSKPMNKPTAEPLMSQFIPPPDLPPRGGVGNMTIDLNEFSVAIDGNRRQLQPGRNPINEGGRMMMDGEFSPSGMRQQQQQMGSDLNDRRTFMDDSLEEEYRLFRQRKAQQRNQGYECIEANDEMLQMFRRSHGKESQNDIQNRGGGMMPQLPMSGQKSFNEPNQRGRGGPFVGQRPNDGPNQIPRGGGPLLGERSFNEPNQMGRGGPFMGQRPNDGPNQMGRGGGPLLGERPFGNQNRMGRGGGPMLDPRFPDDRNDGPRGGGPLLGQRPFDDQNRTGPSFGQRFGENPNEMSRDVSFETQRSFENSNQMGRGGPFMGQRPNDDPMDMPRGGGPQLGGRSFDGPNQMGRGASHFGQRPFEEQNQMGRGAAFLGQKPFDAQNQMGRGAALLGEKPFNTQNQVGRGSTLLGQRTFDDPYPLRRGEPSLGQRYDDIPNEMQQRGGGGPLLGQRTFDEPHPLRRGGPSLGQRFDDIPNEMQHRGGGPLLGQRPFENQQQEIMRSGSGPMTIQGENSVNRSGPLLGQRPLGDPDMMMSGIRQRPLDDPMSISPLSEPQKRPLLGELIIGSVAQPKRTLISETPKDVQPPNNVTASVAKPVQEIRPDIPLGNESLSQVAADDLDNPDKVMEEFTRKLQSWNDQFETWKLQNKDHPDKNAYFHYEKQWQQWRDKLLDRHEQMKRLQTQRNLLKGKDPNLVGGGGAAQQQSVGQQSQILQQPINIPSFDLNTLSKDVTVEQTKTVVAAPQVPSAPTPLELAAKLLVGMAGPLLQNATSILSATKGKPNIIGQHKKDSTEQNKTITDISIGKNTDGGDYAPIDEPEDMVLDSDDGVDFAADNFDNFEPDTQISEKNAEIELETEEATAAPIGLVHPGPWKPLFSTNLSSDMSKPDETRPMVVQNTSSRSVKKGREGQMSANDSSFASDRVREKPKDTGRNVRDAPFDFRDMLKSNDKDEPRDGLRGWHLLVGDADDQRGGAGGGKRNKKKRKGQEQEQYGRQTGNRLDFDGGTHNRSRFEADRSYDGNPNVRQSSRDSPNRFDSLNSIPFAERTDVWDNPYLNDDDEVPFSEQQNYDAQCIDEMNESDFNANKNIPPLFPNNDLSLPTSAPVPEPSMMTPANKPLSKKQRKRLRSRWGAGDSLQNLGERQNMSDLDQRNVSRRMREIESRWSARGDNELPPLADSGMINRSLTNKEQDIIRTAAEELKSLQDRMERAMPAPEIFQLDIHQIILQPKGKKNQAVSKPKPHNDEPIEVSRVEASRGRNWYDNDLDDVQRNRNEEEDRRLAPGPSGSRDVAFLNRFWDRRSSDAGRNLSEMNRDRGLSLRDLSNEERGFSSQRPSMDDREFFSRDSEDRGFSSRGPEDREFSSRGPEDREFFSRGPGDREFSSRGPGDREFSSRGPGDREFSSRGPGGREFSSRGPGGREFSSQGPVDRELFLRDLEMRKACSGGPFDQGFPSRGRDGDVPVSIDYGHGVPKPPSGSTLIPGQNVFDYFENMFNVDNVQTIDYGHGRKEQSLLDSERDRYSERSSTRGQDSARNRGGRERERFSDRSRERDRSRDRSRDRERHRERERSYERNRVRDRSIERIYGREPRERSRDRNRDQGQEREKPHERNRDDERSHGRGHSSEYSQDRNRERDSRSTRVSRDVDKTPTSRNVDTNEKNLVDQRARETQHVQTRPTATTIENKFESVLIEDLLGIEGRKRRPHNIVIVLRGPPGAGKTYVAKLIKDKEIENGGSAPRMLCLDDYFMVESEESEVDLETGKNVMKYEYEPEMEDSYRNSLFKSFKKTIEDGFFPFIIVDAINNRIRHFEEMFSFAKHKGFQVYVAEMDMDPVPCHRRNIHNRTLDDINKIIESWENTPRHYIRVDVRSLLQDDAITEVEMEDLTEIDSNPKQVEETQPSSEMTMTTDETDEIQEVAVSKWEKLEATEEKLAKLDGLGLMKRKKDNIPQSLEDYLQLPDDYEQRECQPGQKRVRWADVEERKDQEKKRAVGFVVGQTDWQKMTDPSHAEKALNQTKYI